MIQSDKDLLKLYEEGRPIVTPFLTEKYRMLDGHVAMSYGLDSMGYDIRLSPDDFRIFQSQPGQILDPKNFDSNFLVPQKLHHAPNGDYFILPRGTYALGVSEEKFDIPDDTRVLFVGKSTYARCAVIANVTPGEPCVSDDTEVLTESGWKLISDVVVDEKVFCLNNGVAEYQPVQKVHKLPYKGEMLNFKSEYVSQQVTPDHQVWAAICERQTTPDTKEVGVNGRKKPEISFPFERVPARKVFKKHNLYFSRDVNWIGEGLGKTINVGEFEFDKTAWLEFIGCWLGDGSTFVQSKGDYIVKLAVGDKIKKREFFRSVLEKLDGIRFRETDWGFEFHSKTIYEYLQPYSGAKNKRIPREYLNLTKVELEAIWNGLLHSDGTISTNTYTSTSEGLVDDIQELAIKAGYNATKWHRQSQIKDGSAFDAWKVCLSTKNKTPAKILPENCNKSNYDGWVYDLTVPSHVFLVRHNNRVSWTGNCWKGYLTIELTNTSPCDVRIYAGEGVLSCIFLKGDGCNTPYGNGKYQNQIKMVTEAKA